MDSVIFSIVSLVLTIALVVFFILMWVRLAFDWVRVLAPQFRPKGALLLLAEGAYTVTDPPVKFVRRVVPPLRIGGAALDFAWSIVLLVCIIGFYVAGAVAALG